MELGVQPYHGGAMGFSSVWTAMHSVNFILKPQKNVFNSTACFLVCNTTVVTLSAFSYLGRSFCFEVNSKRTPGLWSPRTQVQIAAPTAANSTWSLAPPVPASPPLFFFFFFFNLFMAVFGSSFLCEGFLQLWQVGATLHRSVRASHYRGLSCFGAQAPDAQAQ